MRPLLFVLFLGSISSIWADPPQIDRPIFSGPGVGLGATVSIMDMDSLYGKILQYNYNYLALAELEAIENRIFDRVLWEFHAGVGAYAPRQMYKCGFIGVKMNLSNGKIVDAQRLKARIHKLQGYLALTGNKGARQEASLSRASQLEEIIDTYNQQFFWKRLGIAFWVPLYGEYRTEIMTHTDSTLITQRSTVTSRTLYQDFSQSAAALTYDLGDRITLSLGFNLDRRLFFGASVDISTPTSEFVNSFRNELKPLRSPSLGGTD